MAKPKTNNDEPVSLFPFLSILACLIGVLTFIITGVAISQMDQSTQIADAERAEKHAPLAEQLARDRERVKSLRQAVRETEKVEQELTAAVKERDRLTQLKADAERAAKAKVLLASLSQQDKQIAQLKPRIASLQSQIKADQAELDERSKAPEPAGTIVRPGGSGVGLTPNFIECQPGKIIVFFEGGGKHVVPNGKLKTDARYLGLLDRVAKLEKERVIYLVRPNAVSTYNAASAVARIRQCRYGKLPVPGEGEIDLSPFKEKAKAKDKTNEKDKNKPKEPVKPKDPDKEKNRIFDVPDQ